MGGVFCFFRLRKESGVEILGARNDHVYMKIRYDLKKKVRFFFRKNIMSISTFLLLLYFYTSTYLFALKLCEGENPSHNSFYALSDCVSGFRVIL